MNIIFKDKRIQSKLKELGTDFDNDYSLSTYFTDKGYDKVDVDLPLNFTVNSKKEGTVFIICYEKYNISLPIAILCGDNGYNVYHSEKIINEILNNLINFDKKILALVSTDKATRDRGIINLDNFDYPKFFIEPLGGRGTLIVELESFLED